MSPSETSAEPGLLEHPAEAFSYYLSQGVETVVCEEKHMGSRAVVVICRDETVARSRFGIDQRTLGVCYTRTGRRFFHDTGLETQFLEAVCDAVTQGGLWDEFETDWLCLDCELMPWSVKAQVLLERQYAAVGCAARVGLGQAVQAIESAAARGVEEMDPGNGGPFLERFRGRVEMAGRFVDAYRQYCWPAPSIREIRLAPFHLLASEGAVHTDKGHVWHMETLARMCGQTDDGVVMRTPYRVVNLTEQTSVTAAIRWWGELTERGGEGMVVKPKAFVAPGKKGLAQPALKCRGREYLRIIYGPEYTEPANLERLRDRRLRTKRSLAMREFALGIEALERFVRREPLYKVHECVFGVLALESEPVDPRL